MKYQLEYYIICLISITFFSCNDQFTVKPKVQNGKLDLRDIDLNYCQSITMEGEWLFTPNEFIAPGQFNTTKAKKSFIPTNLPIDNEVQYGTYQVQILMPKSHDEIGLKLGDISSAYKLYINDEYIIEVGSISKNKIEARPQYKHFIQKVRESDTITITIQTSNFHNIKNGILTPIKIGNYEYLNSIKEITKTIGFVILGSILICFFYHFGFWLYKRNKLHHLYLSIASISLAINILVLNQRILFEHLNNWQLLIRVELISFFLATFFATLTVQHFLNFKPNKIFKFFQLLMIISATLFLSLLSIKISTMFFYVVPFITSISFIYIIAISLKAYRKKTDSSIVFMICNIIMLIFAFTSGTFTYKHVGDLTLGHVGFFAYIISLTIVLSRQSALNFIRVEQLYEQLQIANSNLEQTNATLEDTVKARTKELLLIEQKNHALELEKKQRDFDSIKINNQLKKDISKDMIAELEKLQKSDKDLKPALRKTIAQIKHQFGFSDKIDTIESGSEIVNFDFFNRLTNLYPNLTKNERELCSLLKLNLSNKDISIILKSSTNAVNVAKSRLRKKIQVPEGMDLEVFIQKI